MSQGMIQMNPNSWLFLLFRFFRSGKEDFFMFFSPENSILARLNRIKWHSFIKIYQDFLFPTKSYLFLLRSIQK